MSATTLSDYLATKPGLGEHYGTFGDVIRDELGIETLAQAQTRLTESVLVQVRLSRLRFCSTPCSADTRCHSQLSETKAPDLKALHRKVLLKAVRNASKEDLTTHSFDGCALPTHSFSLPLPLRC